jgi:5-methylcytosine-specific restriction endonuclease McrA
MDHMIPLSRGGKNSWENLVTCCQQCNWDKGHSLLSDLKIKPHFLPYKPQMSNMQRLKMSITTKYDEWNYFGI